ncbi:hypothetical protein Vadar_029861 [Vaccinium darrowii]|uniref:Uncharacterized protein n=1 Tax=Vaccinium darrowii TaxID=229202 RepID=A0ACB7Y9T6_9ERIC|nr:hypothetical protein Vadar_029861 [Vaccinium darrowii]
MMPNDRIKNFNVEDIQHSESNERDIWVVVFCFLDTNPIPLLKYVFVMVRANDNGKGRTFALYSLSKTFALYSLLCRDARVSTLPDCQLADEELSKYKKDGERSHGSRLKSTMEKHRVFQRYASPIAAALMNLDWLKCLRTKVVGLMRNTAEEVIQQEGIADNRLTAEIKQIEVDFLRIPVIMRNLETATAHRGLAHRNQTLSLFLSPTI